jgi:TP901 family phage tail tape measure protein
VASGGFVGGLLGGLGGGAIGSAVVRLYLDSSQYNSELTKAQAQAQKSGNAVAANASKLQLAGQAIMSALPAALAVAGAAAVKMALDFENSFVRIEALSNASSEDIAKWKTQVLDLAGATARAPEELADALYFLSSAGLKAADVMPALTAAARGAAVGLGTTADVANIIASAMNAYSKAGLTAAEVTDTLVAAVKAGRAEPAEFATALGRILPIAVQAGVSFQGLTASIAQLTNVGLDVNEATTAMRGALQALAAPGTQAADALRKIGLSAQDMLDAISERGLFGALQMLDQAASDNSKTQADYIGVLRKVIPNVRALTGVLGLTQQEAQKVKQTFRDVIHSSGSLSDAFNETTRGPGYQMQEVLTKIKVSMIELGRGVLPLVVDAFRFVAEAVDFANMALQPLYDAVNALNSSGAVQATSSDIDVMGSMFNKLAEEVHFGTLSVDEANTKLQDFATKQKAAGNTAADSYIGLTYAMGDFENQYSSHVKPAFDLLVNQQKAAIVAAMDHRRAIDKTGDAIRAFAGMTGKVLRDWSGDVHESIYDVINNLGTLTSAFETTPAELQNRMVADAIRFNADMALLLKLKPGSLGLSAADMEAFQKFLIDQGPQYVDAFVRSTQEGQASMAAEWRKTQDNLAATDKKVNELTSSLNDIPPNVHTKVDLSGNAKDKLTEITGELTAMTQKQWDVFVTVHQQGGAGQYFVDGAPQAGGIIRGARGFITRRPTFLVGEGGYNTFAGRGAEAVVPLNQRGIDILAEAVRRGGAKSGPTIIFHGDIYTQDADQFARKVEAALASRLDRTVLI